MSKTLYLHPGFRLASLSMRALEPVLFMLASLVSFYFRNGWVELPQEYLFITLFGAITYGSISHTLGAYRGRTLRHGFEGTFTVLGSVILTLLIMVTLLFSFKVSAEFSRAWVLYWGIFSAPQLLAARYLMYRFIRKRHKNRAWQRNLAIYGLSSKTMPILERMGQSVQGNLALFGVYEDDATKVPNDLKLSGLYRGGLDALIADSRAYGIEELVISNDLSQHTNAEGLLGRLHALPCNIYYCLPLPFFGRVQHDILLQGIPLVSVYHQPLQAESLCLKRALDVSASLGALLLLSPLLLSVAAIIKLTSPGPVFFRQARGGFNGKSFEIYKFRSMRVTTQPVLDASGKERQATRDDQRITPIGRFIRKTSIDELPQLINVLKGDMSLVGPRPHAMSHDDYYSNLVDRYASRQKMKPGLTGWAQLNGWRGETDTLEKMARRIEYDIWYIENYSFALDLKILFLTPLVLFTQKTAY